MISQKIRELFQKKGSDAYIGEAVSQTEHALQTAQAAEQANAPRELVIAAFLHDIGHLLHNLPENIADEGIDDHHEELGGRWLSKNMPPEISEPVRLHVTAKRYLCATDSQYFAQLSPASVQSLQLQGGPLSPEEIEEFEANPHCSAAVQLRRWDEIGKVPGKETPSVEHYLALMDQILG